MNAALAQLNAAAADVAAAAFRQCCGSSTWAGAMAAGRPFDSGRLVHLTAEAVFDRLQRDDWLEAFAAHPRIGAGAGEGRADNRADWSAQEQAGMGDASAAVRRELAAANDAYFERFGFVFLICASGQSAEQMLAALRERLQHGPEEELGVAGAQQRLITHLRLDKLLAS